MSINWLLANFVQHTDGVREAVAVSSDGLLIATSGDLDRTEADQLAAIVSGLAAVAGTASQRYDFHGLKIIMIEMTRGYLVVSQIPGGSILGVVAGSESALRTIGYEISVLADRFGTLLTPALIAESRQQLHP
ncbi:roadblock/LC7 domain-containing protein [Actinoplanes sp. NPDC026670]|jgi:predicted regulator of Ras-like GTPase activity (Roadblock/LC7/MglB family)|uniref:roadblock/LC7 domain-containing protein n=1 Tax=Actinoplanes sp. NPDC026670 TaxID=3154700 RepID=UPI0033EEB33A